MNCSLKQMVSQRPELYCDLQLEVKSSKFVRCPAATLVRSLLLPFPLQLDKSSMRFVNMLKSYLAMFSRLCCFKGKKILREIRKVTHCCFLHVRQRWLLQCTERQDPQLSFCVTHCPAYLIFHNALLCSYSVVNFYEAVAKFVIETFCGKKSLFYLTVAEGCSMESQQGRQRAASQFMTVGACRAGAYIMVDQKSECSQNRDLDRKFKTALSHPVPQARFLRGVHCSSKPISQRRSIQSMR